MKKQRVRAIGPRPAPLAIDFSRVVIDPEGYEWVSGKKSRAPSMPFEPLPEELWEDFLLTQKVTTQHPAKVVRIEPTLYREFVALDESKDGILRFAEKYGMLGLKEEEGLQVSSDGRAAETYSGWRDQIERLRAAVELWDRIAKAANKDRTELDWLRSRFKFSKPNEPKSIRFQNIDASPIGTFESGEIAYTGSNFVTEHFPAPWKALSHNREISAAVYYLENELIRNHGWLVPRIKWVIAPDALRQSRVLRDKAPKFALNPFTQGLFLSPESLLAGLWLQFGWAMTAEHRYLPCEICERLMLVSAGGKGTRRTCSGKCRMRLSLNRTAAAKSLSQGKSREEIATAFGIEVAKLDKWLSQLAPPKESSAEKSIASKVRRSS